VELGSSGLRRLRRELGHDGDGHIGGHACG
jgi:hypothetical protein